MPPLSELPNVDWRLPISTPKNFRGWVPAFLGDSPSRSVRRGEKCSSDTGRVDRPPGNLAGFVDVSGLFEPRGVAGLFEVVEISHNAIFPNKSAAISVRVAAKPDQLPLLVASISSSSVPAGHETTPC